mgnify:FL=1|jgi:hypothetical protein
MQSMVLTKHVYCEHPEMLAERLTRLQSEDFNRVKVPLFDFEIKDNLLTIEVEYIKGCAIGTLSTFRKVILEDVVQRDSEWTFDDYHFSNFVIPTTEDCVYAVDLLSYRHYPDKVARHSAWTLHRNPNSLQRLLHHELFFGNQPVP